MVHVAGDLSAPLGLLALIVRARAVATERTAASPEAGGRKKRAPTFLRRTLGWGQRQGLPIADAAGEEPDI